MVWYQFLCLGVVNILPNCSRPMGVWGGGGGMCCRELWEICAVYSKVSMRRKEGCNVSAIVSHDKLHVSLVFKAIFTWFLCTFYNTASSVASQIPLCRRMLELNPRIVSLRFSKYSKDYI